MDDLRRRLAATLERLHPGKTDFTMDEVMEALDIMGEFKDHGSKPKGKVRKSKRYS